MRAPAVKIVLCSVALLMVIGLAAMPASAQNISGAIFTTNTSGTFVNGNTQYASKCDVALNGGPPPNAPCSSAGLPDGCYVYQVTAPPGGGHTEQLLSQDSITKRFVMVQSGLFIHDDANGTCAKAAAALSDCGPAGGTQDTCSPLSQGVVNNNYAVNSADPGHDAGPGKCFAQFATNISVRLDPYADTPNPGGVYKVYATKISDYDNTCGGVFGFIHDKSKTDNFKAKSTNPPPPPPPGTATVVACKFFDSNGDGVDLGEAALPGWEFDISPNGGTDPDIQSTDPRCVEWDNLPVDAQNGTAFTVQEGIPTTQTNWFNSDPSQPAVQLVPNVSVITQSTPVLKEGDVATLDFGNYCQVGSGGLTMGFWSNKNGQQAMNCGTTSASGKACTGGDIAFLVGLNLRSYNGKDFDPSNYNDYQTWLLSANATNMAYMLSAQLSAMELNVRHNKTNGLDFVPGFGGTINQLMAAADAALNSCTIPGATNHVTTCSVVSSGPIRDGMQTLKNYLDALNNGGQVIPPSADSCPYTPQSFPVPIS